MTPEQFAHIRELLLQARDMPPDQREAYVTDACRDDDSLLVAARKLFTATDDDPSPFDSSILPDRIDLNKMLAEFERGPRPNQIDRYHILELLGEGGVGTVYKAEQRYPMKRVVALKIIKAGHDTKEVISRFKSERQVLALMEHPNIARVIDAGTTDGGYPYFIMEFISGKPVTQFCDEHRLTIRQRLEIFIQICDAVAHAHTKGIVHRDLKASNVLAYLQGDKPTVKVIDFGVAKALEDDLLSSQTRPTVGGQVIGTYQSMSPEQAQGVSDIDTRTDIYSLGLLLYELLTGLPPFDWKQLLASGTDAARRQIREKDPPLPSTCLANLGAAELINVSRLRQTDGPRLVRSIRGDLDWIVMRCLEKERLRRYGTADELAADIHRHLDYEPVLARPPSSTYRLGRTIRRHRIAFLAASAVVLSLAIAAFVSAYQAIRAKRAERRQSELRLVAEQQGRQLREDLYVAQMNSAADAARELGGLGRVRDLLASWEIGKPDLRGWEWYHLNAVSHQELLTIQAHDSAVQAAAWSADGTRLVSVANDPTLTIWNAANGKELLRVQEPEFPASLSAVAWSPDGTRILGGGRNGRVKLWEAKTGKLLFTYAGPGVLIWCVAWAKDGTRFAISDNRGMVRVFDAESVKLLQTFNTGERNARAIDWSPDGKYLAAGSEPTVSIWDVQRGEKVQELTGHSAPVRSVCWSPDGKYLGSCGDDARIIVWDVTLRRPLYVKDSAHRAVVSCLVWSGDGTRLASCSRYDWTVRIWEALTGKELQTFRGHGGPVNSVAWSPDGSELASASSDSTIKIWSLNRTNPVRLLSGHTDFVHSVSWSPDGKRLLSTSKDNTAKIWNWPGGQLALTFDEHGNDVLASAWNPAGTRIATGGSDVVLRIWDPNDGKVIAALPGHLKQIEAIAWSPDGKRIASGGGNGVVFIWDDATKTKLLTIQAFAGEVSALAWSPDGKTLACAGIDHTINLLDSSDGKMRLELQGHREWVRCVAWSPDGKRIASCADDGLVRVWDAFTGNKLIELHGHTSSVYSIAWSPDGSRLASGARDHTVRIWSAETGVQLAAFESHQDGVLGVAWSPDGTRLASSGADHNIFVYDSEPSKNK